MENLPKPPASLTRETTSFHCLGFLLLIVFSIFLSTRWSTQESFQWLLQSSILWAWATHKTRKLLNLNHPSTQPTIYPNLGWANRLTLLRGFLIAFTGGFIFQVNLSEIILLIPALSYLVAAVIDRVDGYIARKTQHESLLGTKLDTEFDALGLLIAPLLAVWIGQIHWTYLSVSLAYYLFQWGLHWRLIHNKPTYQLPLNMSRRAIAGFQMGFLAVALWPILSPPATTVAGFAFMLPLLIGFFIDWLTVSGQINLASLKVHNFTKNMDRIIQTALLPSLRILVLLLLYFALLRVNFLTPFSEESFFSMYSLLISSLVLSALMILLGINGRLFAVILSCLLCWLFTSNEMQFSDGVLLTFVIWIMQFGTGKYSLWLWDDKWVNRYDGA